MYGVGGWVCQFAEQQIAGAHGADLDGKAVDKCILEAEWWINQHPER